MYRNIYKQLPNSVFPQRSINHLPSVKRMVHKVLPFRKFSRSPSKFDSKAMFDRCNSELFFLTVEIEIFTTKT